MHGFFRRFCKNEAQIDRKENRVIGSLVRDDLFIIILCKVSRQIIDEEKNELIVNRVRLVINGVEIKHLTQFRNELDIFKNFLH